MNDDQGPALTAAAAMLLMRRAIDVASLAVHSDALQRVELRADIEQILEDARAIAPTHQMPAVSTLSAWIDERAMAAAHSYVQRHVRVGVGPLQAALQVAFSDLMLIAAAKATAGPRTGDRGGD